jgi:predicted AAA+ superfamily ATPase
MRYLHAAVEDLAADKFVLLTGPRQVGKTTLALAWLERRGGLYLNWDVPEDRERILRRTFLEGSLPNALVLDELHKYPRWKSWLKGLYDRRDAHLPVVVTGSARLDVYRRSGDSMFGRYDHLRLHPFSVGELTHGRAAEPPSDWMTLATDDDHEPIWSRLERRSGFPEPYSRDEPRQHQRWITQRRTLLVRDDLRELSQIRQLALVEHLALLLPERVGSPLSVNALREELEVGHDTVSAWLDALERLYFCFRISPYSRRLARALKKERKLYLWDWSVVGSPAARFENMVASHLLKAVHCWCDLGYGDFDLWYVRDKEKREVDFLITEDRRPLVLFECKTSDVPPDAALHHFADQLGNVARIQLIRAPGVDRSVRGTRIVSAARLLAALP